MNWKAGCGIAAGVSVLIVIILLLVAKSSYNSLVVADETVDQQWAEIDNQLQRRADLIPNLVETVKGYAKHEDKIFTAVADARSKLIGASGITNKGQAAGELNHALSRLLAIAENYPNLKADTSFIRLQDELAGTENRITVARSRYNESAKAYNVKLRAIPTVFFASAMGLSPKAYFEITTPETRDVPKVDFGTGSAD